MKLKLLPFPTIFGKKTLLHVQFWCAARQQTILSITLSETQSVMGMFINDVIFLDRGGGKPKQKGTNTT